MSDWIVLVQTPTGLECCATHHSGALEPNLSMRNLSILFELYSFGVCVCFGNVNKTTFPMKVAYKDMLEQKRSEHPNLCLDWRL